MECEGLTSLCLPNNETYWAVCGCSAFKLQLLPTHAPNKRCPVPYLAFEECTLFVRKRAEHCRYALHPLYLRILFGFGHQSRYRHIQCSRKVSHRVHRRNLPSILETRQVVRRDLRPFRKLLLRQPRRLSQCSYPGSYRP